jgi:hypothetical protein
MNYQHFHAWLDQQPERITLQQNRDQYKDEFHKLDREADRAMRKALSLYFSANRLETCRDEWSCTTEEDDQTMERIYGLHPELMVDEHMTTIVMLRQLAFKAALEASALNDSARSKQQAFKATVTALGECYDSLKQKYEQTHKEESTDV